jgi:CRISPR-associated endonuclease/helicase Cas3
MTATATSPLVELLTSALTAGLAGPSAAEIAALPCVARVERRLVVERSPLSAERVLECHQDQSLVVVNQVRWAQELFADLRKQSPNMPLRLLHSRFFKLDRAQQEELLRKWFGPQGGKDGIIVATQVIEAGIDITCSQEHTVVCPMNAFVQRSGRNVRFAPPVGEIARGEVHVYPLPPGDRTYRPYPEALVRKTWELLQQHDGARLDPTVLNTWVEQVHQEEDLRGLGTGWRQRLQVCVDRIRCQSIDRTPTQVSDLIREVDGLYCVVAEPPPENPYLRDGLSISRGALRRLLAQTQGEPGVWGYQPDDTQTLSWQPLDRPKDAEGAVFAICLSPRWAKYDALEGLRLGEPGAQTSPERKLPERPGYRGLHQEPWVEHSRAVAATALRRGERELAPHGLLVTGLTRRFGIDRELMLAAVRAVGLLHDVAKLQDQWQCWLDTYQRLKDPAYVQAGALAHSDYDASLYLDREYSRQANESCGRRLPHAAPGALLSAFLLPGLLPAAPPQLIVSALGAITAHHGGWLGKREEEELGAGPLWRNWGAEVHLLLGQELPPATRLGMERRLGASGKRRYLEGCLATVSGPDTLADFWPLLAYLTRTLRLSDQKATAEGTDGD